MMACSRVYGSLKSSKAVSLRCSSSFIVFGPDGSARDLAPRQAGVAGLAQLVERDRDRLESHAQARLAHERPAAFDAHRCDRVDVGIAELAARHRRSLDLLLAVAHAAASTHAYFD